MPKKDERALICGQTGSGKSFFARFLLSKLNSKKILIDLKGEFEDLSHFKSNDILQCLKNLQKNPCSIFEPDLVLATDSEYLDDVLLTIHNQTKNITIYIDETMPFERLPGLVGLLTRGRSRNQRLIMGTQRPVWIPRECKTEAQHYYIFRLQSQNDRKNLADCMGGIEIPLMQKYKFFYYDYDLYEGKIYDFKQ